MLELQLGLGLAPGLALQLAPMLGLAPKLEPRLAIGLRPEPQPEHRRQHQPEQWTGLAALVMAAVIQPELTEQQQQQQRHQLVQLVQLEQPRLLVAHPRLALGQLVRPELGQPAARLRRTTFD